jgi:hypothetical protein
MVKTIAMRILLSLIGNIVLKNFFRMTNRLTENNLTEILAFGKRKVVFVDCCRPAFLPSPPRAQKPPHFGLSIQSLRFVKREIRDNFDKNLSKDGELSCNPD